MNDMKDEAVNRQGLNELEVITRILTSQNQEEVETLIKYDAHDYYAAYTDCIEYIQRRYSETNEIPDVNEFLLQFSNITQLPTTHHSLTYLEKTLKEGRKLIILLNMFNKLGELYQGDLSDAWKYIEQQVDTVNSLQNNSMTDLFADAPKRAQQLREYSRQQRIPTGFEQIDKALYGGLSTVEELAILVARTNTGKSWICIKILNSAHDAGFPTAYYSPEMQACFVGGRYDTVSKHFKNSELIRGQYSEEYLNYIETIKDDPVPSFIIEDKDYPEGVSVSVLSAIVRRHGIRLLVVDGISYLKDDLHASRDQEKFKNIAQGLFQLSKKYGCAVLLVMQSNREVKSKDSKEESMPDLFNTEGSDQPGRIATTAFAARQIRDESKLEIKMLKSRNSSLSQAIFSYSWSINEGTFAYIGEETNDNTPITTNSAPGSFRPIQIGENGPDANDSLLISDDSQSSDNEYGDIEF